MRLVRQAVLICFLAGSLGHASYVGETFEGHQDGDGLTEFYFYTDTTDAAMQPGEGVTVKEFTLPDLNNPPATITTKAVFFNLDEDNLTPGDWVYFETAPAYEAPPCSPWMEMDLALAVNPALAAANPSNPALVDEVWYYLYVDRDGDGTDDAYYETLVTADGDPGTPLDNSPDALQSYGKRYTSGDNPDSWDWYNPNDWSFLATTAGVPVEDLEFVSYVGVQIRVASFDVPGGETDYMTVSVDNVYLIPEPSSLMIVMSASFLLLARRRRRRDRM